MIKAIDLANAFVNQYAKDDYLTNMKLNKLVYFAYARYLKKGEVLFEEPIQAWKFGPVIPDVYHAYKEYGRNKITDPISTSISDKAYEIAQEIWEDFGKLTAWDLMELSHQKDSAWSQSYSEELNTPIDDKAILSSTDGEAPSLEGTFAEASDIAFKKLYPVLERLADT